MVQQNDTLMDEAFFKEEGQGKSGTTDTKTSK
jgi:hypothetical protein